MRATPTPPPADPARALSRAEAASRIQRAWRGHASRNNHAVFAVGDRLVIGDRNRIALRGESGAITATIERGDVVGLGAQMSGDVTESFISFLETGDVYGGRAVACALADAARAHGVPGLAERSAALLGDHVPTTSLLNGVRNLVGKTVHIAADLVTPFAAPILGRGRCTRSTIETTVGKVHVIDGAGRGPHEPALVVHGTFSTASWEVPFQNALAPIFRRTVAFDLPAHGSSARPAGGLDGEALRAAIRATSEQVVGEPAWVVGHSLGGLAALHHAIEEPARVRGLILIAPAGAPMTLSKRERLFDRFRIRTHTQAQALLGDVHEVPRIVRPFAAPYLKSRCANRDIDNLCRSSVNDLIRPRHLRDLRIPVLVLWGTNDGVLDEEQSRFFERNLPPHGKMVRIEGAGHGPQYKSPAAVAALIATFCNGVAAAERAARLAGGSRG